MNKKSQYRSTLGYVMTWFDWVMYLQESGETDWCSAEDEFTRMYLAGHMTEVKSC